MISLKKESRWCLWRYEGRRGGGKAKVPYNADGKRAKSDDYRTWIDYRLAQMMNGDPYDGIGVFFGRNPNNRDGVNLCGIDIDGDHNGDSGAHNPLEAEVLALFAGTYAEKSPSGTGVHILFSVDAARLPHVTITAKDGKPIVKLDPRYYLKNPSNGLEFYAGGLTNRFFTFTGDRVSAGDAVTDQTDALLAFLDRYMRRPERTHTNRVKESTVSPSHSGVCGSIDAEARLNIARNAQNGSLFRQLYDLGDTSNYNGDDSAADMALCGMLAFYLNGDPALIDDAFRRSALYRAKWDERRGPQTYGELTIAKVIDSLTDVYQETQFKYRPRNIDLTDAGNAEMFSAMYGDRLRWSDSLGWLVWDGHVWNQDDHKAEALALEFSNGMLLEAFEAMQTSTVTDANGNTVTDGAAKAYLAHARKTRGANGIRNMLSLSKAWTSIPANKLDADPYVLNTPVGLVNLTTGVCAPHDPTAYCTKMTACAPSSDSMNLWEDFLDLVTVGDDDLKAYLKRVAGMSIVGAVKSETVQIAYGGGRNGKSTYFNALQGVLDSYAGSLDADVLTVDKRSKGAALATLRGQRLVVCGELEEGQRLSTKELKRIAATDKLVIEQKYRDPETIQPSHHVCMFTNHLPRVGSTDTGTWRRLTVIPFNAVMPTGAAEVKDYAGVLVDRAGGAILQWMIDGAMEYLANGCRLDPPASVLAATDVYQQREDWLLPFISERCTRTPGATTSAGTLYSAYKAFATERGEPYIHNGREFSEGLTRLGFQNVNHANRSMWKGLMLTDDAYSNLDVMEG